MNLKSRTWVEAVEVRIRGTEIEVEEGEREPVVATGLVIKQLMKVNGCLTDMNQMMLIVSLLRQCPSLRKKSVQTNVSQVQTQTSSKTASFIHMILLCHFQIKLKKGRLSSRKVSSSSLQRNVLSSRATHSLRKPHSMKKKMKQLSRTQCVAKDKLKLSRCLRKHLKITQLP